MAKSQKIVFTCDNCGADRIGIDESDVVGFHGTAGQTTPGGGVIGIEWFACSAACLPHAIVNVIREAWKR